MKKYPAIAGKQTRRSTRSINLAAFNLGNHNHAIVLMLLKLYVQSVRLITPEPR